MATIRQGAAYNCSNQSCPKSVKMLPKTHTIEKKMLQSLFTFFGDEINCAISGFSPWYTSIQTKIAHKSNLHMETTNRLGEGNN